MDTHYPRPKIWQKSDFTNTNQRPYYQITTLVFIILLQKSLKKSIWAADLVLWTISQYDACSQSLSYNPGQKGLGHFPFFTCFCMEFAANLQYTLMNTALTRFFLYGFHVKKLCNLWNYRIQIKVNQKWIKPRSLVEDRSVEEMLASDLYS